MEIIIKGKSKNTVKNYKSTLRKFIRITGKKIEEASINDIKKFLEKLKKEMEPSSVARHAYALKYFLQMAGKYDIASKIEINYVPKLPRVLNTKELERLIKAIESLEEYIVFGLGYFLAMKPSEIADIKIRDIDFIGDKLRTKNRTLHIPSFILNSLKIWIEVKNPIIYLFEENGEKVLPEYISAIFRKLAEKANVNATFHSLRNTRIYEMIEDGKNAEEILKVAGFKSIASLARLYVLKEKEKHAVTKNLQGINLYLFSTRSIIAVEKR